MTINVLMVGDVVGNPGRQLLSNCLPDLVRDHAIDMVVVNVENAAGGFGVTTAIYRQFKDMGVAVMTSGNHIYDKRELMQQMGDTPHLLRPLNFPGNHPGRGYLTSVIKGVKVAVVNLIGRVFMGLSDCPFQVIQSHLGKIREETPVVLVDFHGEATSEKQAMGYFLAGKVSAVVGTHTHVMTADETILAGHTAYITDLGMTGPKDGILGMEKGPIIQRFLDQRPTLFTPAKSLETMLNAVVIQIEPESGKAVSIHRIVHVI